MKLTKFITKEFEKELEALFEAEATEDKYLPNEAFKSNRQRANAGLQPIYDKITDILTLAIINHREETHKEDYTAEKSITVMRLDEEVVKEVESAEASWWVL